MHDTHTHLLLLRSASGELARSAAQHRRAARVARLRRFDQQAERAAARARLLRHAP